MAEDEKNNFDGSPSHREKTAEKKRSDYAVRSKMPEWDENEGADTGFSWSAVAHRDSAANAAALGPDNFMSNRIEFGGKNLENGKFANENFENANFSVANLKGVDFSGANLKGVDFSGADLSLKSSDIPRNCCGSKSRGLTTETKPKNLSAPLFSLTARFCRNFRKRTNITRPI